MPVGEEFYGKFDSRVNGVEPGGESLEFRIGTIEDSKDIINVSFPQ